MPTLPAGFAVAVGLSLILPLLNYFRAPPIADFFGEWSSAVAMSLGVLFLIPRLERRNRLNGALLLPPLLLALLTAVQILLGRYEFAQDWILWLAYLWMFALALIVGQHFRALNLETEIARRLCWAIVIVAGTNALAQFAQITRLDVVLAPFVIPVSNGAKCTIFGNTGQSNQTGLIAWLAIAATLYLSGAGRVRTWLAAALTGLFMISAALTASRMAWLFCVFLAVTILLMRNWPTPSAVARRNWVLALPFGFAAANLVAAGLISALDLPCASAVARLADPGDGGIPVRLSLWHQALLVWQSAPWFGVGAANFFGAAYRLQPLGAQQPLDGYVHNALLQILAEFGVFGLVAVILPAAVLAMNIARRRSSLTPVDVLMLAWLGMLVIHSMLEYPLWYVHFLMLFGLASGLLLPAQAKGMSLQVPVRATVTLMSAIALIGCFLLFYDYRQLDRTVYLVQLQLQMNASSPKIDQTIEDAGAQVKIYRLIADYALALRAPISRNHLEEKVAESERLLRRAPVPDNIARVILFQSLAGNRLRVQENLARLVMFFPAEEGSTATRLREYVAGRKDLFGDLLAEIDAAVAHAPPRRWGRPDSLAERSAGGGASRSATLQPEPDSGRSP